MTSAPATHANRTLLGILRYEGPESLLDEIQYALHLAGHNAFYYLRNSGHYLHIVFGLGGIGKSVTFCGDSIEDLLIDIFNSLTPEKQS